MKLNDVRKDIGIKIQPHKKERVSMMIRLDYDDTVKILRYCEKYRMTLSEWSRLVIKEKLIGNSDYE
jgi:hypothetical protein